MVNLVRITSTEEHITTNKQTNVNLNYVTIDRNVSCAPMG